MSPEEWLKQQEPQRFGIQTAEGKNVEVDVRFPTAEAAPPAQQVVQATPGVTAMSPEQWLAAQTTSTKVPETTAAGIMGAAARGLAPVATGAALGAAMGAPLAGVGAVPGAIAGAGAAALATTVGDPIVSTVNSLLGTKYTLPTQAMEDLLTRLGVAQPKTEAERIVQSTVGGAAGAGGMAQAGQAVMRAAGAAAPITREVARQVAAQPLTQIVGGAGAGVASQAAQEMGFGPVGQIVAGLGGGMAGARVVAPRTPVQLPSDLDEAQRAGIQVLTSDVVPPRTFAQKWMQAVGERIPVVGTGPVRQAQQSQRVQAVKDIAQDFGITDTQITAKKIWDDLATKRGADLTKYKTAKDEVIDKIATAQSNRVLGEQMAREADELTQKAGQLYADQAKLVNRINQLTTATVKPLADDEYLHGGTFSGGMLNRPLYLSKDRNAAQSYAVMSTERTGQGAVQRFKIDLQNKAPTQVVNREARSVGIDPDSGTPASVFDSELHGEEAVDQLLARLRAKGYDHAVLDDIGYGTGGQFKATVVFPDAVRKMQAVDDIVTESKLGWAGQQRIDRLQKRIDEYRSAIDETNTAAVEKRQLAQVMVDDVSGKVVDLPRTVKAIDEQIAELSKLNNRQLDPAIQILRDWKASVQNQDLRSIESLRKQLGEAFKGPELGSVRSIGEKAVSSIYRPLVEDMGDFIKANGDRRDFLKWKVANARLADMMGDVNKTALESVLKKGDATPEVVYNMLFSQKPSEVAQLYRNLTPAGRANARSAIIARAIEKAGGIDNVSPDRFANQVRDLGKSINIFFSGDDLKRVQGLARVINMTKRAGEAAALPPSGVQNFYAMLGIGGAGYGGGIPGALATAGGMATVGGAARLYESAAIRSMLTKFPQLRPGSAEEAELLKRLMSTLAAQQQVETPVQPEGIEE